jgi:uncharacterized protein YfiM (DUF2279 family)
LLDLSAAMLSGWAVYLVVIELRADFPGADAAAHVVASALIAAAGPADGLEHVYVRAAPHGVDLVLFLLAATADAAERTGRVLCARSVDPLTDGRLRCDLRVAVADALLD